jgi:hypothetical protein
MRRQCKVDARTTMKFDPFWATGGNRHERKLEGWTLAEV